LASFYNLITKLKTLVWNLQDLFIFFDKYKDEDLSTISEAKWQLLSSSLKDQKSLEKVNAIATLIKNTRPDICFFTEVGGKESVSNLNEYFLDGIYDVVHFDSNSNRGIDLAILIKPELKRSSRIHKEKVFARGVLELEISIAGHTLHFLLTHLKSKLNLSGKDFEGRSQRQAELKQIKYICQKIKKTKNHHPIIVGDLNGIIDKSSQDFELFDFANENGLADALEWLKKPDFDRFTYIYYNKHAELIRMQLDYFLVGEQIAKYLKEDSQVLDFTSKERVNFPASRADHRLNPSDHYPLLVNLEFS
jgi:endonuclease/exonuclease/phosphatase family metal-dependent hydrolase